MVPKGARVEYWDGVKWVSFGRIGVNLNQYNRLEFAAEVTTAMRVLMSSDLSTGILEVRIFTAGQ